MTSFPIKLRQCLRTLRNATAILAAGLLAGCSPFTVLNGVGPDSGISKVSHVRYGNEARQQLDVFQPAVSREGIVVVFFYGGSWNTGERAQYRFVAQTLTRYGATVVIADYRLYPEVVFPAFMEDAAATVAWTYRNIAQYGGNPQKIYLVGHSAGAHIAALLALDKSYLAAQGLDTTILSGVVGLATPTDFAATLGAQYRPVFVDEATLERAQPVRYVRADAPPMLLRHGTDDTVVLPRNSEELAAKLQRAGAQAQAVVYPDKGHSGLILIFSEVFGRSPILDDTLNFLGLKVKS